MKTHTLDVNLDRYSVSRTPAIEIFPEIADGNYEGFILATCSEVRASRRTTLAPAKIKSIARCCSSLVIKSDIESQQNILLS